MRVLKWLFGFVVVLVLVVVVGGYLLPREVQVVRSVEIQAAPEVVFPHVNSLKATEKWSPWLDIDPNVQTTFTGPDAGVGARLEWASAHPQVGSGHQEIVASEKDTRVETALDFGEMGLAKAEFLLAAQGEATQVTWTLNTDMGSNPAMRWMGLMMDSWVGADYEKGLANLKTLVESDG